MRIGKFEITRPKNRRMSQEQLDTVDERYEAGLASGKKLILGTLSARSGTMWLCDIFDEHDNATGVTERDVISESFYRYITYNKLPIDTSGTIALIKQGIIEDWKTADVSLVFSPYFSHGIKKLYDILKPVSVMFGINDPVFTVQSMYNKGIFSHPHIQKNRDLSAGYQPGFGDVVGFMFGRISPKGEAYDIWNKLTRIGKIAWWANMLTVAIHTQLQQIPKEKVFIFHLKEADQNYEYYKKIARQYGLTPLLSEKKYLSIKWRRVKKQHNVVHEWTMKEKEEFDLHTKDFFEIYKELCPGY